MPVAPTFPGVYIEEIPSGVRTITGVATSITAFLGRASRGPVSEPTTIFSFADFERQFGGLGLDYPMSYTVRDFYVNGGKQAIIVRLVHSDVAAAAGLAVAAAAATAAAAAGATPDSVKKAARDKATTFANEPEKTASDTVAKAAEAAAGAAGAKAADVSKAASTAAGSPLATAAEIDLDALTLPAPANSTALPLVAASSGVWGSNLCASVDYNTKEQPPFDPK